MNKSWLSAGILPVVMMFAACNARLTRADLERRPQPGSRGFSGGNIMRQTGLTLREYACPACGTRTDYIAESYENLFDIVTEARATMPCLRAEGLEIVIDESELCPVCAPLGVLDHHG
ncbi:MAG: hypothetical protein HPZ91_19575 [Lentisphaeria bacterium]|nr:hypothetical protein [Lentisphaeria bacterium]